MVRGRPIGLCCSIALAACAGVGVPPPAVAAIEPSTLPPVVHGARWLAVAAPQPGSCVRIASVAELRRARAAWRIDGAALGDDFVDFDHDALVLVDLGGEGGGRVRLLLGEEEGVDVVQVVREVGGAAEQAPAVLALAVARRPCQLAVVFRQLEAHGPGAERTLAVFARD